MSEIVGSTRARLLMRMMSLGTLTAVAVLGARACSGPSTSSPLSPDNILRGQLSGLCADQQAVQEAEGDRSPATLRVPESVPGVPDAARRAGLPPGVLTCPTTTLAGGPGG